MKRLLPGLIAALGALTSPARVAPSSGEGATAVLSGRISLLLPPRVKVDPGGSVVWIPGLVVPSSGSSANAVTSKDKRFEPRILAVSAGTKVKFPNLDSIYHNAFSLTPGNTFDVGLYRRGASRDVVLKNPGVVRVYCNIHPDMAASVVVVDGTAFSVVQADGSYRIAGIPPGRHEVHLWNDLSGEQIMTATFEAGKATDWSPEVDATSYRRVAHTNKHGKKYPTAKNGADRY